MSGRPPEFRINYGHPLAQGLVFAGFGRHVNSIHFHDSSLYGNHGTLTNFAWPNTATSGWGWDSTLRRPVINGVTDDYIATPLNASKLGSIYTIMCWAKLSDMATVQCLLSCGDDILVNVNASNWRWQVNDNSATAITSTTTRASGQWVHYAVRSTGTGAGATQLFTNGVQQDDAHVIAAIAGTFDLGRQQTGAIRYLAGAIGDPCFCSLPLPDSLIAQCADPAWSIGYGGLILPVWQRVFAAAVAGTTYNGSGICTIREATASGSGTFTAPVYSGSGNCTARRATAVGAATFTAPVYAGSGAATTKKATANGNGTFATVVYMGAGACAAKKAVASGTGTFTVPTYTGLGACTARKATASGSGVFATVLYIGSGVCTARKPTASGSGTYTVPIYAGIGAATARRATATGAGTFTAPVYLGVGAATARRAQCEGAGLAYVNLYTGSGVLIARQAVAAGIGTFTPKASGPYLVAARATFLPGAVAAEAFTPGSQKDAVFLPGAVAGEVISV